ncbi:MAG TPA: hypothetical protein VFE87_00890 [Candidatus Paceibacterota bacterium]|nr:hypothetical protein [Candidatus Paceibacterota bacterium]
MRNYLIYSVFLAFFIFFGYQIYKISLEAADASSKLAELRSEKNAMELDNSNLKSQIEYFADPRNLEKELRARFNVRLPGEKLIIVIPAQDNQVSD